ncbi:MAG: LamG domain-containing protein, partial [Flavobacteriales bacterium]|nr:LamG domain-containing protein [Flavobacteriales bacterium]
MRKLAFLIAILALGPISLNSQSCNNLIGQYCFNGNAASETGTGNHGTVLTGTVLTPNRVSKSNSAYQFNGTSGKISIPVVNYEGKNSFTYAAWVNPSQFPSTGSGRIIFSLGGSGRDQMFGLFNNPSAGHVGWCISTYSSTGVASNSCVGTLPSLNQWYHITFTRTNQVGKLYINGALSDSVNLFGVNAGYGSTNTAYLGSRYNSSQYWSGKIDDFTIHGCALSATEVLALYNSTSCDANRSCSTPAAQYCFNNDVKDNTGYNWHGTAINLVSDSGRTNKANTAYKFNGSNATVSLPGSAFSGWNDYTYSVWVKPTILPSTGTWQAIVNVGSTSKDQSIMIGNHSGAGQIGFGWGSYHLTSGFVNKYVGYLPNANQWYHVAVTRTNLKGKIYINGVVADSISVPNVDAGYGTLTSAYIGSRHGTAQFFNGKIDEVSFMPCALSAAEIALLYIQTPCDDTCSKYTVNPTISNLDSLYCTNASK